MIRFKKIFSILFCLIVNGLNTSALINNFSFDNQNIKKFMFDFFQKQLGNKLFYRYFINYKLNNDTIYLELNSGFNYDDKMAYLTFNSDRIVVVDYKFDNNKLESNIDITKLKIIIPVNLKKDHKLIGELVFDVSVNNCCDANKLFEFLRSKDDKSIEIIPNSCTFFPRSDYPLGRYGGLDSLESNLRNLVDIEENDKFIYTMPNFKTSNNPREIILIQEGVRNNKKFSRQFEFIPYDHKKYTYLREIKEENKKESILSKIQNYCSEKINNLRCCFLKKNNSESINNEEAKRLLPNKAKFN